MAGFQATGLKKDAVIIPEKPVTKPSKDFGAALAVMDTVKKAYPEKIKDKQPPTKEKAAKDTKKDAEPQHQKSAVELLWEKAEDSMTDASDDLYDPSKPTPATPANATVAKLSSDETTGAPVSPIRGADEMKDFLNSTVETPARVVPSDKDVAEKAKGTTEKGKTATSTAAEKKIKSAKDMSSYLNKQLQELEKEKKERGKRKKAAKGKEEEDNDPQTIEEIDAMIKKLHKLKHAKLKAEEQKKQKKKSPAVGKFFSKFAINICTGTLLVFMIVYFSSKCMCF